MSESETFLDKCWEQPKYQLELARYLAIHRQQSATGVKVNVRPLMAGLSPETDILLRRGLRRFPQVGRLTGNLTDL
jgi:hypothetical protein